MSDKQLLANYFAQGGTVTVKHAAEPVFEPHPNPVPVPTNHVEHTGPKHAFNSLYSLDETVRNYGS